MVGVKAIALLLVAIASRKGRWPPKPTARFEPQSWPFSPQGRGLDLKVGPFHLNCELKKRDKMGYYNKRQGNWLKNVGRKLKLDIALAFWR